MGILYTHTNINTPDWKKLSDFYAKIFEMKPVPPLRDLHGDWYQRATGLKDAHVHGIHMALPGFPEGGPTIEFFTWVHPDGTPAHNINGGGFGHIAFAVDDVAATCAQFLEQGGSACGEIIKNYYETKGQTLTIAYMKDPDGNVVEIQKWEDGNTAGKTL